MTTFRGTDIHTDNIHLEPDLNTIVRVRGRDDVLLGAPGRFVRNRLADGLIIPLNGYVKGTGNSREERAESWRDSTDTLLALLDPTLAPGELVVTPPLMGLTVERSITARVLNAVHGPLVGAHYQSWSIELEAVDPPEWAEGSS